jgi:hypothetical protein
MKEMHRSALGAAQEATSVWTLTGKHIGLLASTVIKFDEEAMLWYTLLREDLVF